MIAIRLYSRRASGGIVVEMAPTPQPGDGEVLVRVHAAGVLPCELSWVPTWMMRMGEPRPLPVIAGHELSGEIAAFGPGVKDVRIGDLVHGVNDWYRDGAQAEYCVARRRFRHQARQTGFTNGEEAAVQLTQVVPFLVDDELKPLGGLYEKVAD